MHRFRRNVAAQVAEEIKMVTYATPPMEERRKRKKQMHCTMGHWVYGLDKMSIIFKIMYWELDGCWCLMCTRLERRCLEAAWKLGRSEWPPSGVRTLLRSPSLTDWTRFGSPCIPFWWACTWHSISQPSTAGVCHYVCVCMCMHVCVCAYVCACLWHLCTSLWWTNAENVYRNFLFARFQTRQNATAVYALM